MAIAFGGNQLFIKFRLVGVSAKAAPKYNTAQLNRGSKVKGEQLTNIMALSLLVFLPSFCFSP